jgi:hypothetical protein
MASLETEHEDHELEFLENAFESSDETDAVSATVIAFEKDSEIPPKYVKRKISSPQSDTLYHYQPTVEIILRPEKVFFTFFESLLIVLSLSGMLVHFL